ncbi:hybrid sensor histidine kinase/response regulator transcription factor [Chitinophaga sp. CB10]|uniref:hybrid sensor histidine kinase/response regulator transcription factor n=1 Tax=Chitinophaga sp. CB10 TaxID=1891659 RepID=UPI0025C2A979|nr:hybrid sensor histidine kinase/response regulator transcription factor [Chitinophaga sp. CB10]
MFTKRLLIPLLMLFCLQAPAQDFISLNVNDGLSNNQVNCIYKDSKGFMWFGTMSGLNRYDGTTYRVYRHKPSDSLSISDNYILAIYPAPGDRMYIHTRNGDVVYNPVTEQFEKAAAWLAALGLPAYGITCMQRSGNTYWFAYQDGRLFCKKQDSPVKQIAVKPDSENPVTGLEGTQSGYMLALHKNGELDKIAVNTMQLTERKNLISPQPLKKPLSMRLFIDSDDDLWIYMEGTDYGVTYVDGKTWHTQRLNSRNSELNNDIVNSIVQDDKGQIWIGTDHGGINLLNKKTFSVQHLLHRDDNSKSIAENAIYALYKDDLGIIWCGTYKSGISYYAESMHKFALHNRRPEERSPMAYNDVNCFAEDQQGNLWIGSNGGGLMFYDRQKNTYRQWKHNPNDPGSISADVILSLLVDKDNSLWIGYYYGGLDHLVNGRITHYAPDPENSLSMADKTPWKLFRDSQNDLWIGTLGSGLDRFDPKGPAFYHNNVSMHNSVHSNFITDLTEDKQGNLWIATAYGIDMMDKAKGLFIHYLHDTHGLSNDNVNAILCDSRGFIWAGSRDGLCVFNAATQRFRTFRMEDGLPDNNIIAILEDNGGHLWVSTSNGLSKITPRQEAGKGIVGISCRNFNYKDGLQGDAFNVNAALKLRSGELVFGGANGFNLFDPASIIQARTEPPLVFTSLQLFNRTVGVDEKIHNHVILPAGLPETKEITLRYDENDFSLDFAALDFLNTDKNKYTYVYMLEGFNREWQTADARSKRITYTNINPGTYTLRLKALNDDGDASWKGISLKITIRPPFWATGWAYCVYALLLAGGLFLLRHITLQRVHRRFALAQERKEVQRLHELDMLKIKLFTNLSHEFRTPVSLILAPLDEVIRHEKEPVYRQKLYLMRRNARRLLNLVNQLMDFRRMEMHELKLDPTPGDLIDFIREAVYSFSDLAERKQMQLEFQTDTAQLFTSFDHDKIERILFNLLSNAFKFTPVGGAVRVGVQVSTDGEDAVLELKVQDTGIGIPADRRESVFEQFFKHDVPGGINTQGSGIGLAITREFVKLCKGQIGVESEVNKGTVFTILLPFKREAGIAGEDKPGVAAWSGGWEQEGKPLVTGLEPVAILRPAASGPEDKPLATAHEPELKQPATPHEPGLKPAALPRDKATVLLVEDNDDFRFYLKENMQEDYNVLEAANGVEGWQKVLAAHPDLVVSDVNMPLMDGISLCAKIRSDSRTRRIPVILLTAMAGEEQQLKALDQGAADYLVKPFNVEIMLSRVRNVLAARNVAPKVILPLQADEAPALSPDEKFMQKALEIVERNLSNPDFSVEELSRELCMNRVSVYRRIFAISGQPPIEFIRGIRLQRAAQLLSRSEMNVAEVAYEVGFNNPKYFSKYFKMVYHMLPSAYQAANRKQV